MRHWEEGAKIGCSFVSSSVVDKLKKK